MQNTLREPTSTLSIFPDHHSFQNFQTYQRPLPLGSTYTNQQPSIPSLEEYTQSHLVTNMDPNSQQQQPQQQPQQQQLQQQLQYQPQPQPQHFSMLPVHLQESQQIANTEEEPEVHSPSMVPAHLAQHSGIAPVPPVFMGQTQNNMMVMTTNCGGVPQSKTSSSINGNDVPTQIPTGYEAGLDGNYHQHHIPQHLQYYNQGQTTSSQLSLNSHSNSNAISFGRLSSSPSILSQPNRPQVFPLQTYPVFLQHHLQQQQQQQQPPQQQQHQQQLLQLYPPPPIANIPVPNNIDVAQYPDMTTLVNSNSLIPLPLVEHRFVDHKVCEICGKRITRDMSRHMRTHQVEARFTCKFPKLQCRHKLGRFNRPYDYKKHLLNRHFQFDDPDIKRLHNLSDKLNSWGTCPCGIRFLASVWLSEHILVEDLSRRCHLLEI